MNKYLVLCALVLIVLISACVSAPISEKPQYTHQHYTYSVLLEPDKPGNSPKLDIAISLLHMEYPAEQAEYFNEFFYSGINFDTYKDQVIDEQRKKYRGSLSDAATRAAAEDSASYNWRHSETVDIKSSGSQGIVVERDFEVYSGGAHTLKSKRYYVLDMDERKQFKVEDFFYDYQEEKRLRDIVYFELGKYSKLESGQKLSEGIFFSDEPELSFNFFVCNEGLGLHWDPYQIAPYSEGSIEIILPWQVIRPLLSPASIELLTKFDIYLFI